MTKFCAEPFTYVWEKLFGKKKPVKKAPAKKKKPAVKKPAVKKDAPTV